MKSKTAKLIALLLVLCMVFVGFYVLASNNNVTRPDVSATVIGVIDKPNLSEDGYYEITAEDDRGQRHVIDATGYLNALRLPEDDGKQCINVPKVKQGDRISFNLPKNTRTNQYIICYDINQTGYYFKLN